MTSYRSAGGPLPRPVPQIEMRAPGSLKPNPRNARKRAKREIRRIADSIESAGNLQPIVIDEDDVILAGHGRLAAAKLLKLPLVPTIKAVGLSDVQKRLYTIADNKLTENAGWDRDVLASEFAELSEVLKADGLDLTLTGFDPAEIDAILHDLAADIADPGDAVPKLQASAVSRRGDLWLLGSHRLMCADARSVCDVERLMAGAKARLAFTDPPYNLKISSFQGRGRIKHREFLVASGEQSREEFVEFLTEISANIAAACVDGAIVFLCIDWRHIGEMLAAGEAVFSELKNLIVWNKTSPGQGSFYRSQHELIFAWKVGAGEHVNAFGLGAHGRMRANVWTYAGANVFKSGRLADLALRPTVKPVALVADALRDCSMKGDIVVDPFMGSGTTIMAAEKVGRRAYGMDLDPLYVDVAIRRWKTATKADVTLAGDGRTFEEIAAERASEESTTAAAGSPPQWDAAQTGGRIGEGNGTRDLQGGEDGVALAKGKGAPRASSPRSMTDDQDETEPLDGSDPRRDDPSNGVPPEKKVGYGCPPVATRFKPGQSGNPRGRPKGLKGVDQVLRQALERRVPDPRKGGRHKVSMLELIVEGLVLAAARRDPRMIRLLVGLVDRYAPSDAPKADPLEIEARDRDILDEYVASFTAALDKAEAGE